MCEPSHRIWCLITRWGWRKPYSSLCLLLLFLSESNPFYWKHLLLFLWSLGFNPLLCGYIPIWWLIHPSFGDCHVHSIMPCHHHVLSFNHHQEFHLKNSASNKLRPQKNPLFWKGFPITARKDSSSLLISISTAGINPDFSPLTLMIQPGKKIHSILSHSEPPSI